MWGLEKGTEDYSSVAYQLFQGSLRKYSSLWLLFSSEKFLNRLIAGKAKGILAKHTTRPSVSGEITKRLFLFYKFQHELAIKKTCQTVCSHLLDPCELS